MAVMGLELSFHDVLVHKCSLNVREQSLLQAVCLGPVWHPQIIALKIDGGDSLLIFGEGVLHGDVNQA